jgi:hypothetical protein
MRLWKLTHRAGLVAALAALTLGTALAQDAAQDAAKPKKPADGKRPKAAACDPQRFVGTYRIVSGKEHDKEMAKEELAGTKTTITAATIVTYDKDERETYSASYKLSPGGEGFCRLTMTSKATPTRKEVTTDGLIKREGRAVTLIYALPGGAAPDDFEPEAQQQLFVLRPERKKQKPAATE